MDHTNLSEDGKIIAEAMRVAERSDAWTAKKAGIARTTFDRKMHGGSDFTVREISRIAKALGVPPVQLLPTDFHQPSLAKAS